MQCNGGYVKEGCVWNLYKVAQQEGDENEDSQLPRLDSNAREGGCRCYCCDVLDIGRAGIFFLLSRPSFPQIPY